MLNEYTIEITVKVQADCDELAIDRAREAIGEGRGRSDIIRMTPILETREDDEEL